MSGLSRYWRRRISRHAAIALFGALVGTAVIVLLGDEGIPVFRLSMATAYASLALLACSLLVGPVNVIRRRANPVSSDLRRDVGIWAGVFAVAHVVFGLQVHLPGRMLEYFLWSPDEARAIPVRYDWAGLTNWSGLIATLVLLALLVISNDAALRRLGTARWKFIQRWSYAGFALIAVHGAIYQVLEDRPASWILVFALVIALVGVLQTLGARARVTRGNPKGPPQ